MIILELKTSIIKIKISELGLNGRMQRAEERMSELEDRTTEMALTAAPVNQYTIIAGGTVIQPLWKYIDNYLETNKITMRPTIAFLGVHAREMKTYVHTINCVGEKK